MSEVLPPIEGIISTGDTPLVEDQSEEGAGRCFFKLESFEPGGHLTDRLAPAIFEEILTLSGGKKVEVVLEQLSELSTSITQYLVPKGWKVTIFHDRSIRSQLRLREMATHYGARLKRTPPGELGAAHAKKYVENSEGKAALLPPTSFDSVGRELAQELTEQLGEVPTFVLLPSAGAAFAQGLRKGLGGDEHVELLEQQPSTPLLIKTFQKMGRQGILVSPEGAAVIELAWSKVAEDPSALVIAMLPDGGHRHLGWVRGWGEVNAEAGGK